MKSEFILYILFSNVAILITGIVLKPLVDIIADAVKGKLRFKKKVNNDE